MKKYTIYPEHMNSTLYPKHKYINLDKTTLHPKCRHMNSKYFISTQHPNSLLRFNRISCIDKLFHKINIFLFHKQ